MLPDADTSDSIILTAKACCVRVTATFLRREHIGGLAA
jgi:hypothetical protein